MTVSVPSRSLPGQVTAYQVEIDGGRGYIVHLEGRSALIDEDAADKLGRYLLFGDERAEVHSSQESSPQ